MECLLLLLLLLLMLLSLQGSIGCQYPCRMVWLVIGIGSVIVMDLFCSSKMITLELISTMHIFYSIVCMCSSCSLMIWWFCWRRRRRRRRRRRVVGCCLDRYFLLWQCGFLFCFVLFLGRFVTDFFLLASLYVVGSCLVVNSVCRRPPLQSCLQKRSSKVHIPTAAYSVSYYGRCK